MASRVSMALASLSTGAICLYANARAATQTDVNLFLPLYQCLHLCLNCLAGILIWHDDKAIDHWYAYISIYVLIIVGSYEVSSLDINDMLGSGPKRNVQLTAPLATSGVELTETK